MAASQNPLERAASGIANLIHRSARILSQTLERRVQMNICAVDKLHSLGLPRPRLGQLVHPQNLLPYDRMMIDFFLGSATDDTDIRTSSGPV